MKKLDSWLIERFEIFCHWTQRLIGLTALLWFRLSLVATLVQLSALAVHRPSYWAVTAICALRFLITFLERNEGFGDELTANPEKLRWQIARPVFLIGALIFLPMDYLDSNLWYQCAVLGFYFEACDDLPPGISKVKAALRSLMRSVGASVATRETEC